MTKTFLGLAGAPGIGIGSVIVYRPELFTPKIEETLFPIDPEQEWQKFLDAHAKADAELEQLSDNPNSLIAELFAAHRVILQDKTLLESVRKAIFEDGTTAALATHQVITELADLFLSFEDEYFSGRATDVSDLGHRLLVRLGAALGHPHLEQLPAQTILVAADLPPSNLTQIPTDRVVGIALAHSTPTAHSAIIARSLGIPMVCALDTDILHLLPGQQAIVDGNQGQVLTSLPEEEFLRYREIQHALLEQQAVAVQHAMLPAITCNGLWSRCAPMPTVPRKSPKVGTWAPTALGCCAQNICSEAVPPRPPLLSRKRRMHASSLKLPANLRSAPWTRVETNLLTILPITVKRILSSVYVGFVC